MHKEQNFGLKV